MIVLIDATISSSYTYSSFFSQELDGQDETIIPQDYEIAGEIVDDEIHELLEAYLPQGVRLTAIMDCCHSGSVFDLPYSVRTCFTENGMRKET